MALFRKKLITGIVVHHRREPIDYIGDDGFQRVLPGASRMEITDQDHQPLHFYLEGVVRNKIEKGDFNQESVEGLLHWWNQVHTELEASQPCLFPDEPVLSLPRKTP